MIRALLATLLKKKTSCFLGHRRVVGRTVAMEEAPSRFAANLQHLTTPTYHYGCNKNDEQYRNNPAVQFGARCQMDMDPQ